MLIPIIVHKNKPCLKVDFAFEKLLEESASAINGVIAVEKTYSYRHSYKHKTIT